MRRQFLARYCGGLLVLALLVTLSSTLCAEVADPVARARAHFARGSALARSGDFSRAAEEFEAAHRTSPNHVVLYSLAEAYLRAGRFADARDTFQRYLSVGGESIDRKRRAEVEAALAVTARHLGGLDVTLQAVGVEVFVDGKSYGTGPFEREMTLSAGTHAIFVLGDGYEPLVQAIDVAPEVTRKIVLEPKQRPLRPAMGLLRPRCSVPAVAIRVGERTLAAGESVALEEGAHGVTFSREGYVTDARRHDVRSGGLIEVDCRLSAQHPLSPASRSTLSVRTSEEHARVLVDGRRFDGGELPRGPHQIEIQRDGFLPHRQRIDLRPGEHRNLDVRLIPTPTYRAEYERRAGSQRRLGYGLAATGAALGGGAAALFLWNTSRARSAHTRREQFIADLDARKIDQTTANASWNQLSEENASLQRVDSAALMLAIGSGACLGAAVLLFGLSPDPERYSAPTAILENGGASVRWSGRF